MATANIRKKVANWLVTRATNIDPDINWNNLSRFQEQTIALGQSTVFNNRNLNGHSIVFSCVNLLSESASTLPLMITKNKQVNTKHYLNYILEEPSDNLDRVTFLHWISRTLLLYGQFHARILRSRGAVVELIPYFQNGVYAYPKKGDYTMWDSFFYRDVKGHIYLPHEILRVREPYGDLYNGISRLAEARLASRKAEALENNITNFSEKGTRPSALLVGPPSVGHETLGAVRTAVEQFQNQQDTAGKLLTLPTGYDLKQWSLSAKDSEFVQSERVSYLDLCRLYGVPPAALGILDSGNSYASVRELYHALVRQGIRPHLKKIEVALTTQLLTSQERKSGYEIVYDLSELTRPEVKDRVSYYAGGLAGKWLELNEIRELENLPKIKESIEPQPIEQEQEVRATDKELASFYSVFRDYYKKKSRKWSNEYKKLNNELDKKRFLDQLVEQMSLEMSPNLSMLENNMRENIETKLGAGVSNAEDFANTVFLRLANNIKSYISKADKLPTSEMFGVKGLELSGALEAKLHRKAKVHKQYNNKILGVEETIDDSKNYPVGAKVKAII